MFCFILAKFYKLKCKATDVQHAYLFQTVMLLNDVKYEFKKI